MREAYSHEVSSCGFWPGNGGLGYPAFYAYAYPEPAGFGEAPVPPEASYHKDLGQFILPYDAVRTAAAPDDLLLAFLQSTYEACADNAHWDRRALERQAPVKYKIEHVRELVLARDRARFPPRVESELGREDFQPQMLDRQIIAEIDAEQLLGLGHFQGVDPGIVCWREIRSDQCGIERVLYPGRSHDDRFRP